MAVDKDRFITIWNTSDWSQIHQFRHCSGECFSVVAFDEYIAVGAGEGEIVIYKDFELHTILNEYTSKIEADVNDLAFSPNGKRLAISPDTNDNGRSWIVVFDVDDGNFTQSLTLAEGSRTDYYTVAFADDGILAAAGREGRGFIFSIPTESPTSAPTPAPTDGQLIEGSTDSSDDLIAIKCVSLTIFWLLPYGTHM